MAVSSPPVRAADLPLGAVLAPGCRELSGRQEESPRSLGGLCARHRSRLVFLCFSAPDSAVSGSESITRLSLCDKLIRAARHVEWAAPPSWLVRYLPVGGSAARQQEESPPDARLAATAARCRNPRGHPAYRTPGLFRDATLIEYFLERAAGLVSETDSQRWAGEVSEAITLKHNEGSCFFL